MTGEAKKVVLMRIRITIFFLTFRLEILEPVLGAEGGNWLRGSGASMKEAH